MKKSNNQFNALLKQVKRGYVIITDYNLDTQAEKSTNTYVLATVLEILSIWSAGEILL